MSFEGTHPSGNQSRGQALRAQQIQPCQIGGHLGTGNRALIDTDLYLFKAAAASTFTFKWDDNNRVGMTNIAMAMDKFRATMDWIEDELPGHAPVLCLGGRSNFRYGLYPGYKANRREKIKPWGFSELLDWAKDTYLCIQIDNLETDDILGSSYLEGDVIVSGDKDMKTIPGTHFQGELVFEVSEDQADHNFFMQALHGDATDGYPGCPGVGPVMANKLLAGCESNRERWQVVMTAYRKKGFDEFHAITQARMARILRPGEYDHDNEEPKLWIPPL